MIFKALSLPVMKKGSTGEYKKAPFYMVLGACGVSLGDLAAYLTAHPEMRPEREKSAPKITIANLSQQVRKKDLKISLFEALAALSKIPLAEVAAHYETAKKRIQILANEQ